MTDILNAAMIRKAVKILERYNDIAWQPGEVIEIEEPIERYDLLEKEKEC